MDHIIKIDKDLCIGCKKCINDCPSKNIELINKKANIIEDKCLFCGHCQGICPKGAIYITGYSEEVETKEKVILNPDTLMEAIKTRRTIRNFKEDGVEDYIIKQIIEAGRYAPTAKNAQDVSFVIIDNKKDEFEKIAVSKFRKLKKVAGIFSKSAKRVDIDDDFFFKGAPLVILVIAKSEIDGSIAAQNMATMAESCDLGVLFSGFFTVISRHSRKIKRELNLNRKEKVVMTLVIGKANVKYLRTTNKEDAKVLKL